MLCTGIRVRAALFCERIYSSGVLRRLAGRFLYSNGVTRTLLMIGVSASTCDNNSFIYKYKMIRKRFLERSSSPLRTKGSHPADTTTVTKKKKLNDEALASASRQRSFSCPYCHELYPSIDAKSFVQHRRRCAVRNGNKLKESKKVASSVSNPTTAIEQDWYYANSPHEDEGLEVR